MEVMLEVRRYVSDHPLPRVVNSFNCGQLYNTLKALGWEWREKPNFGMKKAQGEEVDPRDDSDIFFLETRCRINDVVVRPCTPLAPITSFDAERLLFTV